MKTLLVIITLIMLSFSCTPQYTCPTYMKNVETEDIIVKKEKVVEKV